MKSTQQESLSRRERQIMDVVFRLGEASAKTIQEQMPEPPSYSAVRAMLAILEEKGVVKHKKQARRYIYQPTVTRPRAQRQALKNLMRTFFEGSPEKLVASLLDPDDQKLSPEEIERIHRLIDEQSKDTQPS